MVEWTPFHFSVCFFSLFGWRSIIFFLHLERRKSDANINKAKREREKRKESCKMMVWFTPKVALIALVARKGIPTKTQFFFTQLPTTIFRTFVREKSNLTWFCHNLHNLLKKIKTYNSACFPRKITQSTHTSMMLMYTFTAICK